MNDAPPPLVPPTSQPPYQQVPSQQIPYQASPAKSGSGGKWALGCGCGCLTLIIIAAIAGWMAFNWIKAKTGELVASYTATESVAIEVPEVTPAEVDTAVTKYDTFRTGMEEGGQPVPLVLSESDINALIFNHPTFTALAGKGKVSIENERIRSEVSVDLDAIPIPFDFIAEAVKGKFFNGEVILSLGKSPGHPALYIEGLEVNGAAMPETLMEELRKQDILTEIRKDPEAAAFIDKIQEMKIENGALIVIPKGAP